MWSMRRPTLSPCGSTAREQASAQSQGEQFVAPGETLELDFPAFGESELLLVTNEVVCHHRHDDLSTEGVARNPRRIVNRRAEEVLACAHDVSGMDADPSCDGRYGV